MSLERPTRRSIWIAVAALVVAMSGQLCLGVTHAQQSTSVSDAAPLVVAFGQFPPYAYFDETGARTGFSVELAEALGQEIGVDIEYADFSETRAFVQALISGEAQMFPGIARLPVLEQAMVFSDQVATETLRLMTRADRLDLLGAPLEELRIGIIPPAVGSHVETLRAKNTLMEFPSPDGAIVALLAGDVDGVLAPNPTLVARTRAAGVDGRVKFLDSSVQDVDRFVALHQSRADLMPALNAAIERLEADGRLAALRMKYTITLPEPVPDVLTVGLSLFPPYKIIGPDGEPTGFAVEVLRGLAERAGLNITFKQISREEWERGPVAGEFDMLTLSNIDEEKAQRMDFMLPTLVAPLSIFTRIGEDAGITGLADLQGRKIGVVEGNLAKLLAEAHDGLDLVVHTDHPSMLSAMIEGEIDAALFPTEAFWTATDELRVADKIVEISPPFHVTRAAPALRFGLGSVRERLNVVLPAYLISDEYASVRRKYFGARVFWPPAVIYAAGGAAGLVILALIGALIWQQFNRRRLEIERQQAQLKLEQAHSRQLSATLAQLEKSNREQAEFTYAISHDLKSPANTIGMLIEELGEVEDLGADGLAVLKDMTTTNLHMRRLVDDVLAYSRIVDEAMTVETIDLAELIDEIRLDLASEISNADAVISSENLHSIDGNRMQVRMLLQNLISNSVKFRAPERAPRVEVSSRSAAEGIEITVTDNGIGIPEEFRDRVFGLFQRLNVQLAYEGTGLGLTICQRVMSNHKGRIWIGPGLDGGSAFTMVFPLGLR